MTLFVNQVTLATVIDSYLKKTVNLFSPEGLQIKKNPNLVFIMLAYRATFGTGKISQLLYGSLVTSKIAIFCPFALG